MLLVAREAKGSRRALRPLGERNGVAAGRIARGLRPLGQQVTWLMDG